MKRLSIYVITMVLTCAGAAVLARVAAHQPHYVGSAVNNPADAAFRDGIFQGRLDSERGRRRHLSIGRWNVDADRRSFVAGYLQAYREMYARRLQNHPELGSRPSREVFATVWQTGSNKARNLGGRSLPPRKTTKEPTGATQKVMAA